MISGHKISYEKYPFFAVQQGSSVEVQLIKKFVNIEYSGQDFYFVENEKVDDARKFIIKFFEEIDIYTSIHVQRNSNLQNLIYDYKLKSDEKYNIKIPFCFSFRHISNNFVYSVQKMDLSAKVSDAQQRISIVFCDNNELNPENISIYNIVVFILRKTFILKENLTATVYIFLHTFFLIFNSIIKIVIK